MVLTVQAEAAKSTTAWTIGWVSLQPDGSVSAPLLSDLKALANKRDVPYQSLLKVFVADRVAEEWRSSKHRGALSNKALQPTSRGRPKAAARRVARVARG